MLFLHSKKYQYVEGCSGRTLRFSARHSLRHVAPVRVSMYQNLSAIVASSIGFQNLPRHREVVTLPDERLDSQHDATKRRCASTWFKQFFNGRASKI